MTDIITYKDVFGDLNERALFTILNNDHEQFDNLIYSKIWKDTLIINPDKILNIINFDPFYPTYPNKNFWKFQIVRSRLLMYLEEQEKLGIYVEVRYDEDTESWYEKYKEEENIIAYRDVFGSFSEDKLFERFSMHHPKYRDTIYAKVFKQTLRERNLIVKDYRREKEFAIGLILINENSKFQALKAYIHQNLIKYLEEQKELGFDVRVEYDPKANTWKEK